MEYPPFTSKETGDWGLPASAGFEGGQQKGGGHTPHGPQPLQLIEHSATIPRLVYRIRLKGCLLLLAAASGEPVPFCL